MTISPIHDALGLSKADGERHAIFCDFADRRIAPHGAQIDRDDHMQSAVIDNLREAGLFGMNIAQSYGGLALDAMAIGLWHEALASASTAVRSVLTAHAMICGTLGRWGSSEQRVRWCPDLARGDLIAAIALTEDGAGSDLGSIAATAIQDGTDYVLSGTKLWITGGQLAHIYLVAAKCDGQEIVFLVERDRPGVSVEPVAGMLGLRGAMLANCTFRECRVPRSNRIGATGPFAAGLVASALDFGRYTIAWGAVGIARDCLERSMQHAETRRQGGGKMLREHQLISALLAEMIVGVRASSMLCQRAARLREEADPDALWETAAAKYYAAEVAAAAASSAVQIFGARGCAPDHPAQRHYRDAKILELIEGSTQIQQQLVTRLRYESLGTV